MKAFARKTYFLKKRNDERRKHNRLDVPGRLYFLLDQLDDDSCMFNNAHAQFLADFMGVLKARQGRMVKRLDVFLAGKLLLKLMKSYNHLVLKCNDLEEQLARLASQSHPTQK